MVLVALLGAVLFLLFLLYVYGERKVHPKSPPGIYGWPILGSLPSFNKSLIEQIEAKREQFGDAFIWKIGSRSILFLCDPAIIRKAFNNPFLLDRPHKYFVFDSWSNNRKIGVINSNGEAWVTHRRFSLKQMRDSGYGKSRLQDIIHLETEVLLKEIQDEHLNEAMVVPLCLNLATLNTIWRLVADKRFDKDDPELNKFQQSLLKLNEQIQGLVNILDIFPWLVPLTPKFVLNWIGFGELQQTWQTVKLYIKKVIAERKASLNKETPNGLIDAYLSELENQNSFNEESLLILLGDLFIAGSETTSSTIRFALQYMSVYPDMQKRAQRELDAVVPEGSLPSISDKPNLPFMEAFVNEILRITTVAPLGVFHEAAADTELENFFIPKGTVVSSFLYGCHRSPKYWDRPDEFRPQRFLNAEGKFNGKTDALIPFSVGRRHCLGETLANYELFLILSAIVNKFSIEISEQEKVSFKLAQKPQIFSFPSEVKVVFRERAKSNA